MKIAFVLTVHLPDDERVWYQQAATLKGRGHEVSIISSKIESCHLPNVFCFNDSGLSKRFVIQKITDILSGIEPEVVICDNPVAISSAKKYSASKKKRMTTIYDITEWYPSLLNINHLNIFKKIVKFISLIFFSIYAGCVADKFIFGEYYKGLFFRILFPFKKFIYLSYFANIEFIKQYPIQNISKRCELFYSGNLTEMHGFDKVLKVAQKCAEKMPNTKFVLKIITTQKIDSNYLSHVENLELQLIKKLPFLDFCAEIGKSDLFFDLRKNIFIKKHSLPIKIFYYLAAARPVIYTDSNAIRKFFPKNEIQNFGHLVNPNCIDKIVEIIENYVNNPDIYTKCCNFSYEITQNKYNWNHIKEIFIDFVEKND